MGGRDPTSTRRANQEVRWIVLQARWAESYHHLPESRSRDIMIVEQESLNFKLDFSAGSEIHVVLGDKFSFRKIKLDRGEDRELVISPDFRSSHVFGLSSDGGEMMEVGLYRILHGGTRVVLGQDGSVTLINNQDKEERMICSEMKIYKDQDQNEMKNLIRSINPGMDD